MTVEDLLFFAKGHIHSDHAKILIAELLGCNPLELLNHLEEEVPEEKVELLRKEIKALEENIPLQYVLGHINFYGNDFYIDERVLIPRFETEELVENTIKYINKYFPEPVDIIDLGTGSGVIGLTLEKKVSTKSVDLIDISKEALEVTHINCEKLSSKANIIESDMFSSVEKKYDVIISNPPYIKTEEEIESIVKENEPHIALYAGPNGLDCYQKILENIKDHMKERCLIAFEIGYTQKEDLKQLISKYLPTSKVEVKKDLSGKDRMIFITVGIKN
jgi:release factor glutamine methyltransferase